ncbi:MAG: tetratricopeptide repeat protein [Cyanobacteria bacterium]|nr:tetratricopeptide repeat protein [Cyanobacteriota bacterium]
MMILSTHPFWKSPLTVLLALSLSLATLSSSWSKTSPSHASHKKETSKKAETHAATKSILAKSLNKPKSIQIKSIPKSMPKTIQENFRETVFKPTSTSESGLIQRTTSLSLNKALPITKPAEKVIIEKVLKMPEQPPAAAASLELPKTPIAQVPQVVSHIQQIILDRGQALLTLQFTDQSVLPDIQQKLVDPNTRVITVLFPGTQWDNALLKDSISLQEAWSGSLPGLESVQLFQEGSESLAQQRPTARLVLTLNPSLAVQLNEVTDSLTSLALIKAKKNTPGTNDTSDTAVQLTAFPQVTVNLGQPHGQPKSKKLTEESINPPESSPKTPIYSIFQLLPEATDTTVWDGALKQAWLTFQSDRAELGLLNLKQFVDKSPDNVLAQFLLATAYRLKGRVNESINAWSVFVEKYPQQKQAWVELTTLYLSQKNWDKAEQTLTNAQQHFLAATDADRVDFWYLKARLLEARNQPESALNIYHDILKVQPLHSKALQRALRIKPDPILEKQRQFYEADSDLDTLQEVKSSVLSPGQPSLLTPPTKTSLEKLQPEKLQPEKPLDDSQTSLLSQWLSKGLLADTLFSPRKTISVSPALLNDWASQPLSGKLQWVKEVQSRTEKARQLSPKENFINLNSFLGQEKHPS